MNEFKVEVSSKEIRDLFEDYDRNNANQVRTAGGLEYTLFEMISKKIMKKMYSKEWLEAFNEGYVYNHDAAQELFKGLNCFTIDPRFILRKGIHSYGDNHIGVSTKPAKHFNTAIEHLAQAMGLSSTYIAGGIALASFNVFLAPYIRGMEEKDIKQVLQGFMYQMNEAYKNRGSQSLFSSICLDLEIPKFLKNEPAVTKCGEYDGVYGDYEKEAKLIVHLITEISYEGDKNNKPILFPNLIYNIDGINLTEWIDVFELVDKYALPYFSIPSNNGVEYSSTLGCRSSLPSNWTGDPQRDCMGTGNSVYTTLNLPAIALKYKYDNKDNESFYEILDYYAELIHKYNLQRLERIKWLWYDQRLADFMIQELDGKTFYRLDDATIVMGYIGLDECLRILNDKGIAEDNETAKEIMLHMRSLTDKWKKEDNLRWGLFQTPAENCSHKLAIKMVKKYGFKKSRAKGTATSPYYTNSNHVPVDEKISLGSRLLIEGNNQPIGAAGNIMNIYTSETFSDPFGLMKLVEKIRDKTKAYFFAITGEYSICSECNSSFKGVHDECLICGSEKMDIFSRITGYVTNTKTWNKGKQQEFKERHRYGG